MSRLLDAWNELLDAAQNGDFDEQQDALFQIGLILENHNPAIQNDTDMAEDALSRELLRLSLAPQRQQAVIQQLLNWAQQDASIADACLYAASRAQAKLICEPLLQFIVKHGMSLHEDVAYQATTALDACARSDVEAVNTALNSHDPRPLLKEWQNADDDLLADKALFTLRRIDTLMGQS